MQAHAEARVAGDPIAELIAAGRHRDAAAACAREHGASIGRLCMALLGDPEDAAEVVQETLIAAHDAMGAYRGEGSVRGWLLGIARRKCARKLETRIRRQRRLRLVHDAEAAVALPDEVLEAERRAARVRDALDQLKPTERDAVVLRYQSGLDYREIAEACGIDEAAARKRVSRALARMKSLLGDEVGR